MMLQSHVALLDALMRELHVELHLVLPALTAALNLDDVTIGRGPQQLVLRLARAERLDACRYVIVDRVVARPKHVSAINLWRQCLPATLHHEGGAALRRVDCVLAPRFRLGSGRSLSRRLRTAQGRSARGIRVPPGTLPSRISGNDGELFIVRQGSQSLGSNLHDVALRETARGGLLRCTGVSEVGIEASQ